MLYRTKYNIIQARIDINKQEHKKEKKNCTKYYVEFWHIDKFLLPFSCLLFTPNALVTYSSAIMRGFLQLFFILFFFFLLF